MKLDKNSGNTCWRREPRWELRKWEERGKLCSALGGKKRWSFHWAQGCEETMLELGFAPVLPRTSVPFLPSWEWQEVPALRIHCHSVPSHVVWKSFAHVLAAARAPGPASCLGQPQELGKRNSWQKIERTLKKR